MLAAPTPRSGMPSSVCFDLLKAAPEGKKERSREREKERDRKQADQLVRKHVARGL